MCILYVKAVRALSLPGQSVCEALYFFPSLPTTPAGRGQDYVQYARRGWMEMDATGR